MVGAVDSTLKFALSALWNLTDETPAASRNFIGCQGLELYEEVLEVRWRIQPRRGSHDGTHAHFFLVTAANLCCSRTTANPPFSKNFWASWWVQSGCLSGLQESLLTISQLHCLCPVWTWKEILLNSLSSSYFFRYSHIQLRHQAASECGSSGRFTWAAFQILKSILPTGNKCCCM